MTFDWTDYQELACTLQSRPEHPGPCEAALRTATSRAYYAALHRARHFAGSRGHTVSASQSIHIGIPNYFINSGIPALRAVGNRLKELKKCRNAADYDDQMRPPPNSTAAKAVALARRVIDTLDTF